MDGLNLEVAWEIDNAKLKAELAEDKKSIEGVGQTVDKVEAQVQDNLNQIVAGNKKVENSYKDVEKAANNISKPIVLETAKAKSSFNGLQNSINQIGRELPAFTYSAQTGFMAISNNLPILADEIAKIRKENELLSASGQKGVPVWKQLVGGLLSWQTAMVVGITLLTVYGKEISSFFGALFKGNKAIDESKRKLELLSDVRKEASKNAASEMATLRTLNAVATDNSRSMEERRRAAVKIQDLAKSYNQNISTEALLVGGLKDEYNKLTEAIIASAKSKAAEKKIQENAEKRLDIEFEIKALQEANEERKKAIKLEGDKKSVILRGGAMSDRLDSDIVVETVEERQKNSNIYTENEIKNVKKRLEVYDKEDKFLQQFIQVPIEKKETTFDSAKLQKAYAEILKISEEGLQKIKDLDSEYSLFNLSEDDKELAVLKKKFEDFRKILEDENKKIIAYNKKNKKDVALIDVSQVAPIEQKAEEQLRYTQETSKLQKQYDEEYKLFVDYQKLKKETSAEYADKRFAEDLEAIKTFESRLNNEIASIDPKTTNGLELKRLEELNKLKKSFVKDQQAEEDKRMMEAFESVKSFNDKRLEIEKKYQEMRKALGANITPEQESAIQKKESKDISKLAVDELQQSEAWAMLFSDLDRLTISQIDKLVNEIETRFDDLSVNFDPIDLAAIRQKLQEAREEIIDKNPFKAVGDSLANIFKGASEESGKSTDDIILQWRNLSKATDKSFAFINDAVNSTAFLQEALGETGTTAIGMLQSISLAAIGVATAIKTAEKASVILAVIQAALVAMQAVFSFLDSGAKRRNEELKKEQEYYNVLSDTFDILIDKQRKLFEEKNGKGALKAYEEALELVGAKQVANRKSLEAWFSQGASWNSHSNWYKYDRDLGNVLSRQKLLNMTGKEWEDLLRNQPELWARLPQEVRSYAQSVVDAKEETEDLKKTIQEALTGVSLDDLRSEFESLASNANLTFEDISNSFYKNMQKAVLRLIQDEKFTSDMKNWYDNLLSAMDDETITEAESNLLKEQYKSIAEAQNSRYKAIMDVIGYTDNSTSSSSLSSSGIERVSEQTGTELVGLKRADLDVSKQHLVVSQKTLEFNIRANDMMIQALKHQAAIEQNTANTVDQLKLVVGELKTTNRNLGGKYGG